jgi:hypothetical protein
MPTFENPTDGEDTQRLREILHPEGDILRRLGAGIQGDVNQALLETPPLTILQLLRALEIAEKGQDGSGPPH